MRLRLFLVSVLLSIALAGCALWPFKTPAEQLSAVYIGLNEATLLTKDLVERKLITPTIARSYRDKIGRARDWAKKAEDALAGGVLADARSYISKAKVLLGDIQGALAKEG